MSGAPLLPTPPVIASLSRRSLPAVITVRCHYCSRFRHPREILKLAGGIRMCWRCHEWHQRAILALATGEPPEGCFECRTTFADLNAADSQGNVPMYLHVKDGMYQFLCQACSDRYLPKRLDLYGDTAFGWEQKLKGAK